MNIYPLGSPLHESCCTDRIVCLIGIAQRQVQETVIDTDWTYLEGGDNALCFAFVTRYNDKTIQSDVKVLKTLEGLAAFQEEFETKLPELKKRIDDEKNSTPTEIQPMDSSPNP